MTNYKKSLLAALLCAASVTFAGCEKDNGPKKPIYVPEEISEAAVNLSENGTANCYIVKPGSVVSFTTSHKGNSETELTGEGSTVKLVWQDSYGLVKNLYFDSLELASLGLRLRSGGDIVHHRGQRLRNAVDIYGQEYWSYRYEQRFIRQLRYALPMGPQGSVPWSRRIHYPERRL